MAIFTDFAVDLAGLSVPARETAEEKATVLAVNHMFDVTPTHLKPGVYFGKMYLQLT